MSHPWVATRSSQAWNCFSDIVWPFSSLMHKMFEYRGAQEKLQSAQEKLRKD